MLSMPLNQVMKVRVVVLQLLILRQTFKRTAPSELEDLEREIGEDNEGNVGSLVDLDVFWAESGQPIMLASLTLADAQLVKEAATAPEFYDGEIDSIQFSSKGGHRSKTMSLGGAAILLWEPDEVIDDSTLAKLGFLGMQEEIQNLDACRTGEALTEMQVANLKRKHQS